MLACKSFKQSSTKLCEAIASMAKTLCTQYIDPLTLAPLVASRLIPLDKGEGSVRPIGVGEVIRRIMRVLDVEHGSFTPLVFTTTGGMGKECIRYHSRLAELIAAKKGEQ